MSDPSHICGYHVERVGHHPFCGSQAAKWAYAQAMQDALAAVMNAVRPLGAYGGATDSPWNKGYTQALHEAEAALIARLHIARTNRDAVPLPSCTHCGPLSAETPLYALGGEQFHAVLVREGDGPGSYYGPTPDEFEPCGPVTRPDSHAPTPAASGDSHGGTCDE